MCIQERAHKSGVDSEGGRGMYRSDMNLIPGVTSLDIPNSGRPGW